MMTDKQLIAWLLEQQEHPEQVTDEQLWHLLNDDQMHELVEQMAFTKRALKNEESLTEELPIADEWEKFAASHAEELDALDEDGPVQSSRFNSRFPLYKIAASLIVAVLVSGIAFAAIHIVRQYQKPETTHSTDTTALANSSLAILQPSFSEDTLAVEPRIFDNVPLDTMLMEMAAYYHVSVEFDREEVRQLRFHFVWKRTDELNRLVEKLNNFEAVNIILESEKLIVR